jgi:hypothetical protein
MTGGPILSVRVAYYPGLAHCFPGAPNTSRVKNRPGFNNLECELPGF